MNCHGNNFHPDLPLCVRCGSAEFSHCITTIGGGLSVQYACARCGIRAVFRYAGPPGVLVWANTEQEFRDLNAYLYAVQDYRFRAWKSDIVAGEVVRTCDPSVPFPTTILPVHRLDDGAWVRLESTEEVSHGDR